MKPSKTIIDAEEGLALLLSARTTNGRGRGLIVAVAAAAFVLGALAATTTTGERLPGSPTAKVCDRLYGDGADNICNDPNLSPIAFIGKRSCERQ